MAIGTLNVINDDHFAKGGVIKLEVAEQGGGNTGALTVSNAGVASGNLHQTAGSIYTIDFEKESAKMSVSMSKTDGLVLYNISVEGYIPKITGAKLETLYHFAKSNGLRGKVYLYDDKAVNGGGAKGYLLGFDNVLANSSTSTDFPLILESIEADTGSALQDQNGVTVKFSCVQAIPPAQYAA